MSNQKSFIDQCFEKAQKDVFDLPSCTNENKLKIYGLYKQSIVGDIDTAAPRLLSFRKAAQWESWKGYEGMSQTVAKREYVNLVNHLLKTTTR